MSLLRLQTLILFIQRVFLRFEPHVDRTEHKYDPVFIIGAPRTGSTLLFQFLLQQFHFGYISNIMALFPMFMSGIGRLTIGNLARYNTIKKSNYGVINGLHAPNEAGKINELWFEQATTSAQQDAIRNTINKISNSRKAPMLIKSLGNSLRVENILKVFPNAKFVVIKRDVLYTAQSILLARESLLNSRDKWVSIKPKGYERIISREDPYAQVVWQINEIEDQMRRDLISCNAEHVEVNYRQVCEQPAEIIQTLKNKFDWECKDRPDSMIGLKLQEKIKLDEEDWKQLEAAVDQSPGK